MTIHIESLKIDAIVGILDFERVQEQQLIVDLQASYRYDKETFINYAELADLIEIEIKRSKYELLEEALLDLKEKITSQYPKITQLKLKISKPHILKNTSVALSHSWDMDSC